MLIEQPAFVPAASALVRRDRTSVPDVWRHYDVDKAERAEATAVPALALPNELTPELA